MIDKRPRLIARCAGRRRRHHRRELRPRRRGLLVAIRGGGHNGPGLGSCDDGLVIDLSAMKGVRVDPARRTVRVERRLHARATSTTPPTPSAWPCPSASSRPPASPGSRSAAASGYLTRKHGLTIDNLLEADVVLADGRLSRPARRRHPDLFWALRGGGGNFGVVTSFLFQAHPVSTVYAGPIFWDLEHARPGDARLPRLPGRGARGARRASSASRRCRPCDPFPKEHWGKRSCALISCYNGPADDGATDHGPLLETLPAPIFNWMGEMPFPAMQSLFDPLLPEGPAVVLEGRLRARAHRRGDRRAHRAQQRHRRARCR